MSRVKKVGRADGAGQKAGTVPKKHGRRTAEESEKTRRALLDAAAAAFAQNGLNGAKLDDIAKRTGVTKGAIYSHFADREDLLLQACRAAIRSLKIFEFAREAPDMATFFNETAQILMASENMDVRRLNVELHLSATRSEHMAELLSEWHLASLDTLRHVASPGGDSPEATMVVIHVLLLGLSQIDAFDSIGADRDEVLNIANRLVKSLSQEIK